MGKSNISLENVIVSGFLGVDNMDKKTKKLDHNISCAQVEKDQFSYKT